MREQLIQYVNLLFAGAADAEEIKMEILQNTLDRYDDLIEQGKSPEAVYRLAITGIGDINEILGATNPSTACFSQGNTQHQNNQEDDTPQKKQMRAVAVAMYILCAAPLLILSEFGLDTMGLCLTLALVAAATALMILGKKKDPEDIPTKAGVNETPQQELHNSINNIIWAIGLAVYFIVSFTTKAWFITWIIFPIIGSVQGLVKAIIDLKEANRHEN